MIQHEQSTRTGASLKSIELNKDTREIHIVINAKGSNFVEEPKGHGFPQFYNGACLVDGIKEILERGHLATNQLTNPGDYREFVKENQRLRQLLCDVTNFELGERVTVNGLTYQKAINENSFYNGIKSAI